MRRKNPSGGAVLLGLVALAGGALVLSGMTSASDEQSVADIVAAYPKSAPIAAGIVALARKIGAKPAWIANVIHFESGGTWRSDVTNGASGAVGLIQFIEPTAKELGTTTAALRLMSPAQQFQYVDRYFMLSRIPKPLASQIDVFMAVYYPAAIGKGPNWIIGSDQSAAKLAQIQAQNPGIRTAADYARFATKNAKMSVG